MKPILAAAAILSVAFGMTAQATPINYSFSVAATTGSLSGTTAAGTFTYDSSSSLIPGGDNSNVGLLTSLDFTWNGITYDQTTANTGQLFFNSSRELAFALFGSNCGPSICSTGFGTNSWFISGGGFFYATPSSGGDDGTATLSLVTTAPEPSALALLGVGIAGTMVMGAGVLPRGRRSAIRV